MDFFIRMHIRKGTRRSVNSCTLPLLPKLIQADGQEKCLVFYSLKWLTITPSVSTNFKSVKRSCLSKILVCVDENDLNLIDILGFYFTCTDVDNTKCYS